MGRYFFRFSLAIVSLLQLASLAHAQRAPLVEEKVEAKKNCTLTVIHENFFVPDLVLVGLYQDNKLIRTRELRYKSEDDRVSWSNLAPGTYEVHFEALGYGMFTKRFALAEGDDTLKLRVELAQKPVVLGGNESQEGLQKQLEELKAKVKALQVEVEKLRKVAPKERDS